MGPTSNASVRSLTWFWWARFVLRRRQQLRCATLHGVVLFHGVVLLHGVVLSAAEDRHALALRSTPDGCHGQGWGPAIHHSAFQSEIKRRGRNPGPPTA